MIQTDASFYQYLIVISLIIFNHIFSCAKILRLIVSPVGVPASPPNPVSRTMQEGYDQPYPLLQ